MSKEGKINVSKQKLYLMTLLSITMILILVSTVGRAHLHILQTMVNVYDLYIDSQGAATTWIRYRYM